LPVKREQTPEEIAEIFTVALRTVYAWIKDGCPHTKSKNKYLLNDGETQNWIDSTGRKLTPGRPKKTDAMGDDDSSQDKEYWLARKYKRECLVAERNLYPRDDVLAWIRSSYAMIKGRLIALPPTIVSAIAGHDEAKQERLVADEINLALDDLKSACEKFEHE
jgi:hypothetical protein